MEDAFTLLSKQIAVNNMMLKAIIMSIWGEEKGKEVCIKCQKQIDEAYEEVKEKNNANKE